MIQSSFLSQIGKLTYIKEQDGMVDDSAGVEGWRTRVVILLLEKEWYITCYSVYDKEKPRLKSYQWIWFNFNWSNKVLGRVEENGKVPTRLGNWETIDNLCPGSLSAKLKAEAWLLGATVLFCSWAPCLERHPSVAGTVRINPCNGNNQVW